jgi:TolB-like protein/class 3 adenylate cyclase
MKKPVERRLAAILAADVAGYSRLMGADEEGTLDRLKAHRRELIDPKIKEHRGRIVKTTGDGMLVQFPSVVDAVRCAVEVQRAMLDRNAEIPEDKRITFRIGVNLGDVIIDSDDIYGDGVNIAARLEALAEPGGICISRVVRDQIPYPFEDMDEQSVKNIARPIHVFAMNADAVAATPLIAAAMPLGRARNLRRIIIPASVIVGVFIAIVAWGVWSKRSPPTASVQAPAVESTRVAHVPRLSVVVLPFANLSNDPEQEYFADGITDDLTSDLTRITDSFVIARNTAFTYKGKAVDVKQVGKELGVRYALEGSVRRTGQQVQVNVQLVDTETGGHIWADRLEADRTDLAKAQDQIVARLARRLQLEIVEAATRRIELEKPTNPEASDFVMRGWAWYYRPNTVESLQETQGAFERALQIDPQSVAAKIGLAFIVTEYVAEGRSHVVNGVSISREQDMARADQLLLEVLERDRDQPKAYLALGRLRRLQNRLAESKIELENAIALDRNNSTAILQLGITLLYLGQPEAAVPQIEHSLQLNPLAQNVFFYYFWLGDCHLLLGQPDAAIDFLMKSRAANPRFGIQIILAAAFGLKGDLDSAKATLAESLRLRPEWNSLARLAKLPNWNVSPQYVALREKTIDVGLRRAGLPDE